MVNEPHVDPGGEAHTSLASSLFQRLQEQGSRSRVLRRLREEFGDLL
jgi:hypothetical protein